MDLVSFADTALGLSAVKPMSSARFKSPFALVVYIVVIAYLRVAKKRFLGEATVFDAIPVIINWPAIS